MVNGKEAAKGEVTEQNADVMQLFDLKDFAQGRRQRGDDRGEGRDEPDVPDRRPALSSRGRRTAAGQAGARGRRSTTTARKLSTADLLRGQGDAEVQRRGADVHGDAWTWAFRRASRWTPGDFAEMVAAKKVAEVQRDGAAGDAVPGRRRSRATCRRSSTRCSPKYPVKAKTPATVAYEYYTPANRGTAKPVEITVEK